MSRYLQRISLQPYTDAELWTGWDLEGRSGEIEGLLLAEGIPAAELQSKYGVTEFQKIPLKYLEASELRPRAR